MTEHDVHEDPRAQADGAVANFAAGLATLYFLLTIGEEAAVRAVSTDVASAGLMICNLVSHLDRNNAAAA